MSPDDPSLHVPPGERRKFIARCVGLWTAAALVWGACASLRHWEDVKEWAFGGALMVAVLVAQGLLERRLRRRWLPPAGQTR